MLPKNVDLLSSQIANSGGQKVGSSELRYFDLESCVGDLISISSKQNFFNNTKGPFKYYVIQFGPSPDSPLPPYNTKSYFGLPPPPPALHRIILERI